MSHRSFPLDRRGFLGGVVRGFFGVIRGFVRRLRRGELRGLEVGRHGGLFYGRPLARPIIKQRFDGSEESA